ncbi:MAG: hypothetical protein M1838_004038 [Thelocarpon superellum]|nr:MAG: hypothetical protein M1838_004038 [Thelocarpon superellum]
MLTSLPPEIIQAILTQLPTASLFNFSLTCRNSRDLARGALRTLVLGVFSSRVNGLISFMESSHDCSTHAVAVVLERRLTKSKRQVIENQNHAAAAVLLKHGHSIRDLELLLWEPQTSVVVALVEMKNLRRLSLNFDHPHTRHSRLEKSYWAEAPPGTIWNWLAATPSGEGMFGRLESLWLRRAGLTDYQLDQIIRRNPRIRDLRLQKCLNLTHHFFKYLAKSPIARSLETLHFTQHDGVEIDNRILPYLACFPSLKNLSLYRCSNVGNEAVKRLNAATWHITHLSLPYCIDSPPTGRLEVDPAYK